MNECSCGHKLTYIPKIYKSTIEMRDNRQPWKRFCNNLEPLSCFKTNGICETRIRMTTNSDVKRGTLWVTEISLNMLDDDKRF